jgi:hypothetical protein
MIGQVMAAYAKDHNGKFPIGANSIEVFQKLMDENYVTDPSLFYKPQFNSENGPDAATTPSHLSPEKVWWDVTIPVDSTSPDDLPLVFESGFRIRYSPGAGAVRPPSWKSRPNTGIAVCTKGMMATYWKNLDSSSDAQIIPEILPANFNPKGVTYIQLTPGGPLP